MANPTPCPDRARLGQLLSGDVAVGEHDALTGHLDGCTDCQGKLEQLAVGDSGLSEAVRAAAQEAPPAAQSAYWPAVHALEREAAGATTAGPPSAGARRGPTYEFLEPSQEPGSLGRLGHFDVERLLGRGGMGMVLRAFDSHLQRHVAIKVLDPQLADDPTARKRFCREARAAASITHENVVTIYHVEKEETSGLPFLVMQVVPGESLQDRLDRDGTLPVPALLRIGLQVALGLAAAHDRGLIHRDIKPANILLEAGGDRVKLTDFGLARAAEDVRLTQTGFVTGTPLYMAPEQARGEEVDHRADLYSLGAVLYQMAAGRPPFEGETPLVLLRRLDKEEARPIHELNPAVPTDLGDLIDGLLAKDPDDRPQSAAEVAGRLAGLLTRVAPETPPHPALPPVKGRTGPQRRRPRPGDRFWMFAAAAPWAVALVLGLTLSVTELTGLTRFAAVLTRPAPADADRPPSPALRMVLNGSAGPVWAVAFAPDGKTVAMAIDDGTLKVWDAATGRIKATVNAHRAPIWSIAFAPDGRRLATASDDSTVKVWDAATWKMQTALTHATAVRAVAFAPDGRGVVTGARNGSVRVWDVATGKATAETAGHDGVTVAVAYAPDGKTIASAGGDKAVKLWDTATGQELVTLRDHVGGVYAVAFSPDGKTLASGGWDRTVRLWDAGSGTLLASLKGHTQDIWGVAFAPDGATLGSVGEDRVVHLWDVAGRRLRQTHHGHDGTLYSIAFAPDGAVASGGRDGTVRLWAAAD